jgi:predicted Fe-S protein YdhL (DUF1289 family)
MDFRRAIVSPCINVCTMDAITRLCAGCGRKLEEITRWTSMSDGERAAIMRELPARQSRDKQRR